MVRLLPFVFAPTAHAAFESWSLTLLEEAAKWYGAVCLDGSPSGYFIEAGQGDGADKWSLFLQGGGWCLDEEDCLARSKTDRGSSRTYTSDKDYILGSYDGGAHGFFSNDPAVNPDFHNWNKVYVRYCDGGSWAGEREEPVEVSGEKIYFRGARILNALIRDLLMRGLNHASDLIIGGSSAGGLATYLHADHFRRRVPPSVKVAAVPQCGFFMDLPYLDGSGAYTENFKNIFHMMGARFSGNMNEECFAAYRGEEWRCYMTQYNMRFIKTPFFAINSFFDAWQWNNTLKIPLNCPPGSFADCAPDEQAAVLTFRDDLLGNLSRVIPHHSAFYTYSCATHSGQFLHDDRWATLQSGGLSLRDAFSRWYFHGDHIRISAPAELPNQNPTCFNQQIVI